MSPMMMRAKHQKDVAERYARRFNMTSADALRAIMHRFAVRHPNSAYAPK